MEEKKQQKTKFKEKEDHGKTTDLSDDSAPTDSYDDG